MWVVLQDEWSLAADAPQDDPTRLETLLAGIDRRADDMCVVLPLETKAALAPETARTWADVEADLAALAKKFSVYLTGAIVAEEGGVPAHAGFIFGPDGARLLKVGKSLPDLAAGYRDISATLGETRSFDFAETPLGRIGMVIGEDIMAPHIVRATVLAGAEVVLNPWLETADTELEARNRVKRARSYENSCYVISVSPLSATDASGKRRALPYASSVSGPAARNLLPETPASQSYVEIDIEALRVRRGKVFPPNFPVYHRTHLFAQEAKRQADAQTAVKPAAIASREGWRAEAEARAARQAEKTPPALESPSYGVLLAQTMHYNVTSTEDREIVYTRNLDNAFKLMDGFASIPTTRLAVIPEFALHGVAFGLTANQFADISITLPGPEMDRIAEYAMKNKIYIAACSYERDPDWPGRFFNTAFIIDDRGELIHRYRKIMCSDLAGMQPVTTPGGVYSQYIDRYGFDGLFPVVDTPLGALATMICFDINFSETARALVKRGAEIILHPTSEPHNAWRNGWDLGRRARAFENRAYVLSAGIGGSYKHIDDVTPGFFDRGYSKIIDYNGDIALIAEGPGEVPLMGDIDVGALRRARADARRNWALWDDASAYADYYLQHEGYPSDVWVEQPMQNGVEGFLLTQKQVERYFEEDRFKRPAAAASSNLSVRAD